MVVALSVIVCLRFEERHDYTNDHQILVLVFLICLGISSMGWYGGVLLKSTPVSIFISGFRKAVLLV